MWRGTATPCPRPSPQPITLAAHQKAADYTVAKTRFGLLEMAWGAAVLLGWTLLGGLDCSTRRCSAGSAPACAQQLALLAAFALIGGLLDLPFTLWQTFVLEAALRLQQDDLAAVAGRPAQVDRCSARSSACRSPR